ncbi:galactokinase [Cysteiniphilum halobium]|uniref:galactokinase n=1 Tax=Cysteiniphilum halobium TaxID=2219059 RepID=UPI0013C368BA|nr:galactokinase [Cysteiniphilum halobium]
MMILAKHNNDLHDHYQSIFNRQDYQCFYAPGRVNLIGEHTDYNDGFVMPLAINMGTTVAIAPRNDTKVSVYSKNMDQLDRFDLNNFSASEHLQWCRYVGGMLSLIQQSAKEIIKTKGADIYISSNLPIGAGLSSSASLTVALGYAYTTLYQLKFDKIDIAKLAQQVEHQYIGTLCGIMDQMVCASAYENHALLIDCQSLKTEHIPFNLTDVSLLICDSNVKHNLAESAYNKRRQACEKVATTFNIKSLRALTIEQLMASRDLLDIESFQCAKHIINENHRVLQAANAMKNNDWLTLGKLMYASHNALQHEYKVSCDELDYLIELSIEYPGVYGARMTGGGFGGCTIHLVQNHVIDHYQHHLKTAYYNRFKKSPTFYISRAYQGVHLLDGVN